MRKSEQVVASKHQSMALIGQRINSRNRLRAYGLTSALPNQNRPLSVSRLHTEHRNLECGDGCFCVDHAGTQLVSLRK